MSTTTGATTATAAGWTIDPANAWNHVFPGLQTNSFARLDPYLIWAAVTDFADLGGIPASGAFVPIAIEVKPPDASSTGQPGSAKQLAVAISGESCIWMSAFYDSPPAALAQTRFCTAHVTLDFVSKLPAALLARIERFTLALPVVSGWPARAQPSKPASAGLSAVTQNSALGKTVVAVCDDGIAFAHQRFHVNSMHDHTRVRCFWNQDDGASPPAPGIGFGTELLEPQLDKLMAKAKLGGGFDEDRIYRESNYTDVARYWTHGTSMLDLAAGVHPVNPRQMEQKVPSVPALIGVQFRLPGRNIRDTSGLWLDAQAIDAFRYAIDRAQGIAGNNCRLFINFSYGYMAGPHDGSSLIEEAMDELIGTGACAILLPTGNSNLDRGHGARVIAPGDEQPMRWRVLPDCHTPSFVEIWLSTADGGAPKVDLTIEAPDGALSPPISVGNVATWSPGGDALCTVVHRGPGARGDGPMILVALAPTAARGGKRRLAGSGNWIVHLKNNGASQVAAQAWVQRNETPAGLPVRGRQSRFDDDAYPLFNRFTEEQDVDGASACWVMRANSLNSIGTGKGTAVIAGYRISDYASASFSNTGPNVVTFSAPPRTGPDAAAMTDRSVVLTGMPAAGTKSGSTIPIEGTSAAAPHALRRLADPSKPAVSLLASPARLAVRALAVRQNVVYKAGTTALRLQTFDIYEVLRRVTEANVGAGNIPPPP